MPLNLLLLRVLIFRLAQEVVRKIRAVVIVVIKVVFFIVCYSGYTQSNNLSRSL